MEISELVNLIANVGFPVAISAYLLMRLKTNNDINIFNKQA